MCAGWPPDEETTNPNSTIPGFLLRLISWVKKAPRKILHFKLVCEIIGHSTRRLEMRQGRYSEKQIVRNRRRATWA
jgi:hypothetical protein